MPFPKPMKKKKKTKEAAVCGRRLHKDRTCGRKVTMKAKTPTKKNTKKTKLLGQWVWQQTVPEVFAEMRAKKERDKTAVAVPVAATRMWQLRRPRWKSSLFEETTGGPH